MTLTQLLNEAYFNEALPHGNALCGKVNCDFVTCDNCPIAGTMVTQLSDTKHIVEILNHEIRYPAAY